MSVSVKPHAIHVLAILITFATGCGSQSPKTPRQPTPQELQTQTQEILSDITKLEAKLAREHHLIFQMETLKKDNDPARTRLNSAVESLQKELEEIRESIYSHSDFKSPQISEIRHSELKHDDLATKVASVGRNLEIAYQGSRERREPDQWGGIKGKVISSESIAERPALVNPGDRGVIDSDVCGVDGVPDESVIVDKTTHGLANVVIYLRQKPSKVHQGIVDAMPSEVVLDKKGCRFVPHILAMTTKQKLKFLSDDPVSHEVHPWPRSNRHSLTSSLTTGVDRIGATFVLLEPEITPISVRCDRHSWMSAYLLIVDSPYFAITKEDGSFEIPNLPAGDHSFMVWHEKVGLVVKDKLNVSVAADQTTNVPTITVSAAELQSK